MEILSGQENLCGLRLVGPALRQAACTDVVLHQSADFRLGQLELTLVVKILLVLAKVLAHAKCLVHQVTQVFRDVSVKIVFTNDGIDSLAGNKFYVRNTKLVPQNQTDLCTGKTCFAELDDLLFNLLYIGVGPLRNFLTEWSDRGGDSSSSCMYACHCFHLRLRTVRPVQADNRFLCGIKEKQP